MTKTTTLRRALASVRKSGDSFTVVIAGVKMRAKTRQDAKRRAYKHARNLRIAAAA